MSGNESGEVDPGLNVGELRESNQRSGAVVRVAQEEAKSRPSFGVVGTKRGENLSQEVNQSAIDEVRKRLNKGKITVEEFWKIANKK